MRELLVLWDLDGTLVSAPGLGDRLYREVFRTLFGRDLGPIDAPMSVNGSDDVLEGV